MIYEPLCGHTVSHCAEEMCALAKKHNEQVTAKFNDMEFVANPQDDPTIIMEQFYTQMGTDKETFERKTEAYPSTIQEWLRRWDEGDSVWSVEMGGIGPGYEQAIQITCVEIVRIMIAVNYDASMWDNEQTAKHDGRKIEAAVHEVERVKNLGLSGAQFCAAMNLASNLYRKTPKIALAEDAVKDRLILVSSRFP